MLSWGSGVTAGRAGWGPGRREGAERRGSWRKGWREERRGGGGRSHARAAGLHLPAAHTFKFTTSDLCPRGTASLPELLPEKLGWWRGLIGMFGALRGRRAWGRGDGLGETVAMGAGGRDAGPVSCGWSRGDAPLAPWG